MAAAASGSAVPDGSLRNVATGLRI